MDRQLAALLVIVAAAFLVAGAARLSVTQGSLPSFVAWVRGARLVGVQDVVRQRRSNDCGPAALAEGLRELGVAVPYPDPSAAVKLSRQGCGLEDLAREAERRGVRARLVRLDPSEVDAVMPPAVLHLKEGHFVLLQARTDRGAALLVDPSLGRLEQSPRSLARHWSGYALELSLP